MTPAALRYLAWIDQEADPPARLSLRGWTAAARVVLDRMRTALLQIEQGDGDSVVEYLKCESQLGALNSWAEFSQERTRRVSKDRFDTASQALSRRYEALQNRARKGAARKVVERMCLARLPASIKDLARVLLKRWNKTDGGLEDRIEKLQARHFKRERARSKECIKTGNWLTAYQARQLPLVLRKQARAEALELGFHGWFIKADTVLADEALAYLKDRALRQSIWEDQQDIPENDGTIRSMIVARQEKAQMDGFDTYSQKALSDRTIRSPRKVSSMMALALDQLQKCRDEFESNLAAKARTMGIDRVQPWDRAYIIQQCNLDAPQAPANAFPVEKTIMVAIPELMAIGGWKHSECIVHGTGANRSWQWRMMREDGRRAQLWISPFNPNKGASGTVGHMMLCRSPWSEPGMPEVEAIAGISMSIPRHQKSFDMGDLAILAHEVGHALHFLGMEHSQPEQHELITDDMVEFPSQLLQYYPSDPAVLARWADPAVPGARRRAEWSRHIDRSIGSIDGYIHEFMESWIDLAIHNNGQTDQASLKQCWLEACERFGVEAHPMQRDYLNCFPWEGYAAANYAYPMGGFLAAIFCKYRSNGTIDAKATAKNFAKLINGPLRTGIDGTSFRREWRRFKRESVEASARRGAKIIIKDVRRTALEIKDHNKKILKKR